VENQEIRLCWVNMLDNNYLLNLNTYSYNYKIEYVHYLIPWGLALSSVLMRFNRGMVGSSKLNIC